MTMQLVEPRIRGFLCLTAHPDGCAAQVDRQIDRQLTNGGELIASSQCRRRNAADHLVDDLPVNRNPTVQVQAELKRLPLFRSSTHEYMVY